MKLKEIKSGMVIHCNNQEEYKRLNEETQRFGFGKLPFSFSQDHVYVIDENIVLWNTTKNRRHYVEFSDLVIPDSELTAEEALLYYDQMCNEYYCCNDCPIYGILGYECARKMDGHIGEIVDAIKKWKYEHEKKEPEIETEWFWHGRIFKVEKDGSYYQIKDGTGFYDTGCEYQESAEEYMSDILKEYCKTHDGDFIAVVDRVCRVKAVE